MTTKKQAVKRGGQIQLDSNLITPTSEYRGSAEFTGDAVLVDVNFNADAITICEWIQMPKG
jgi:hypothetical protein